MVSKEPQCTYIHFDCLGDMLCTIGVKVVACEVERRQCPSSKAIVPVVASALQTTPSMGWHEEHSAADELEAAR